MKSLLKIALNVSLGSFWLRFRHRRKSLRVGLFSLCEEVEFGRFVRIHNLARLRSVVLGDFSYVANGAHIVNARIGNFASIGPASRIGLGRHPVEGFISTHPAFFSRELRAGATFTAESHFEESIRVDIGNDVWIGEGAKVLDGVTIGDGAVIGAGAVVTKDLPPYAIAAGVPAKVLRYRFAPDDVRFLLESAWWKRDIDWFRRNVGAFRSMEEFRKIGTDDAGASR